MAYFSDTQDTPAKRGFVPPQNEDERRLMRRVEELCRVAQSRGIPRYTGFLSDREQSLAQAACNRAGCSRIRFWGGFDGAERKVLCIEPPEAWQEEPLAYLQFTACGDKLPTHRDYLGSLMGLQIDRSVVGDILVHEEGADIIVLEDMAEFILMHFSKAGRKQLSLTREELTDLRHAATEEKRGTGSVASPRLDSVAAIIFGLPRKDAQARIEKGLVFVNNAPCLKPEHQINEGDRLTVRGVGRARVESFGGTSRKGRLFLQYVRNA